MEEQEHKRRKRYSGKYPKKYEEKYKELNPEKYAETVEHVLKQGHTPAGMHVSICVEEILTFLNIQPGQQGMDCTLGYGGHTREMLKKLNGKGHLYALDVDRVESQKTKNRLAEEGFGEEILTIINENFADIDHVADQYGKFDFILADLGVSSMQIDNPERGFSFKLDGPLDLRLNQQSGQSAAERIAEMDREEIEGMLVENSDEPYAPEIARAIVSMRSKVAITTTTQLRNAVETALKNIPAKERKEAVKKSCQRTFQALRIDVNSEFEVLDQLMNKLPEVLKPGGRVAILTFHSGEDRMVKKAFKMFYQNGIYSDIAQDVIRPGAEECFRNPRAKSAKLRWAIKA